MSFRSKNNVLGFFFDSIRQIKNFKPSFLFQQEYEQIDVTNFIFKLHSKLTVTILLVGTFFVTLKLFGNPIECLTKENEVVPKKTLEHFCWMEGAFSIHQNGGKLGIDFAYPGVTSAEKTGGRRVNHKYYQWVYFVLLIQAIMFYLPEHVWRTKENNYINHLVNRLKKQSIDEINFWEQKILLQDFFDTLITSENYLTNFIFCEVYYIFNLVFQFWFTDVFLGGSFRNLGWNWLQYASEKDYSSTSDPLVKVFPRLAKCNFHRYDVSGTIVTQDALCFLTINIVNEKIYVILWLWFFFLFLLTSGYLLFHMLLVYSTSLRYLKIRYYAPKCNARNLRILCKNAGNWFILEFVVVNLKPNYFTKLINNLFEEFYDQKGRPILNKTIMENYNFSIDKNYKTYNQYTQLNKFNQNFLRQNSPTNELTMLPSISNKGTTSRRPKSKSKIRTSLLGSALSRPSDCLNKQDCIDNQFNFNNNDNESSPFLTDFLNDDFNLDKNEKLEKRKPKKFIPNRKNNTSLLNLNTNDKLDSSFDPSLFDPLSFEQTNNNLDTVDDFY